ncbi:hypothetical protein [Pseudoxanthomonas sp. 10H]|uniref:hypothetical protein n=1 Tax=Pseudoxanthomonas sp. 10H TaxID=3242729 RepID=UPI003555ED5F
MTSALPARLRLAFVPALGLAMLAPPGVRASEPAAPVAAAVEPGTFFGSLPLHGCAGADALLRLDADGRYLLQSHCRATLQDLPPEHGAWSVEWNGTCVRLVADGLAGAREFAVALDDLLVLTAGSCIEPVDDPRGRSLHRALAPPAAR